MEKPLILLVEDSPSDAALTLKAFEKSKITNKIIVVKNGIEAMAYLRKRGDFADAKIPGLILLDLNLPKKDGWEVLKEIKGDSIFKFIPVIVLSGSNSEIDVLKTYELSANCYIEKPLDFKNLLNVVQSIENFWLTMVKLPPITNLE